MGSRSGAAGPIAHTDGDVWGTLYGLSPAPVPETDRELANWFIATSPDSVFTATFAAALVPADGSRVIIAGTTLRRRGTDGVAAKTEIASESDVARALSAVHVDLTDAGLRDLSGRLRVATGLTHSAAAP